MSESKLSQYELLRLEKIKRNNDRLAVLGLLQNTPKFRSPSVAIPSKRAIAITPSPPRLSRRLRRQPIMFASIPTSNSKPKKTLTKRTLFLNNQIPMGSMTGRLSEDQKKVIHAKMNGNFLGKFEEYLNNIDAISERNRYNVLKQITKLANGEGIRYETRAHAWPEGCYFMKGVNIGPHDDIGKLMDLARKCEEEWGRDHGNGWLLSHPLKKLYMFQQHCLE